MTGTDLVLAALARGERGLAEALEDVADRHRAEHEVHFVAKDLARWSRDHVRRLSEAADERRASPADTAQVLWTGEQFSPPADTGGPAGGQGLTLLRDLQALYLCAVANSLCWEMLAHAAQATGSERLLSLASACHPETLRQMKWTDTMLKNLSPQLLTQQ
ncbi:hypothetical protein [Streptomyces sp. NBC_01013]|uniref:hypothetical protein n=1 Tax=Streptomyces sp. NBC_01013 TaxID=2903718 RepID=UPI0038684A12|nr:hypothetical protein OG538_33775 [Streptomyces sp. NBC_01013]